MKFYEDKYEINEFGVVRDKYTKLVKKFSIKDNGYAVYTFWINGKSKQEYVHRLVAITFLQNPNKLPQVNHKDEDKLNNHISNLEWCDAQYNNTYGTARQRSVETHRKNGTYEKAKLRWVEHNPSKTNPKIKGKNSYAKEVVCDGMVFDCIKSCAEYYGINYGTMRYWLSGNGNIPAYFKEHNLHYILE